jgi:prolyl-tRNA editing enzyme YbaK/EbsC (Cys-tRNA(Pro) deacylase)
MVFRASAATILVALPARSRVHYGKLARADTRTVYCGSGRADQTVQIEAETLIDLVRPVIASVTADGHG